MTAPLRRRPRVLAVSHELTLTGAPLVLLRLLEWLRDEDRLDIEVLALRDGPMADDFAALGPFHLVPCIDYDVWLPPKGSSAIERSPAEVYRLNERAVRKARPKAAHLRDFDLLYLNSAQAARALHLLPEVPPVVVSHLHELSSAFDHWLDPDDRRRLLAAADRFVVATHGIGRHLVDNYGVDPEAVVRPRHELVGPAVADPGGSAEIRARLGIADDALVVGAVGTVGWRKGTDLFVQVAAKVAAARPELDVHFVWVGSGDEHARRPQRVDADRLGLHDRFHLVGEVTDVAAWMGSFDVFALTSREDPFPLVCLEAGSLGVPIVTFANGGMAELAVADGPAEPLIAVVDYLDVVAMADAVTTRLDDPARARAEGARLDRWLRANALAETGAAEIAANVHRLLEATTESGP